MKNKLKELKDFLNKGSTAVSRYLDGRSIEKVLRDLWQMFKMWCSEIVYKIKHLEKTNYDLAILHYNAGNISDAILRFRMLQIFWQNNAQELNYLLGRCYLERGAYKKAEQYLDTYIGSGDKKYAAESEYCKNIVSGNIAAILSVPTSITARTFNVLSNNYSQIFFKKKDVVQDHLYRAVTAKMSSIGKPFGARVLDVGCGDGYIGKMMKESKLAGYLEGIDVADRMVEICKVLKSEGIVCYDKLENISIESYVMRQAPNEQAKFDIVVACWVLGYTLNVQEFLHKIGAFVRNGGILAIAIKTHSEEQFLRFDDVIEEFSFNIEQFLEIIKKSMFNLDSEVDVKFADNSPGKVLILVREEP